MQALKRVAAIHDLSGFGKCSLTVALPILSAMGVEACALPTAILSSHTGDLKGYTYRDLTEDLPAMARHWSALGLRFDAIYTGFVGSEAQLTLLSGIVEQLRGDGTLVLVDPVMGDHGVLYRTYTPSMIEGMAALCRRAQVITPNLTEASFLLGRAYDPAMLEPEAVREQCRALAALGPEQVVITGVSLPGDRLGAAAYDALEDTFVIHAMPRAPGIWYGTGDIFSSVLLGALLAGRKLDAAVQMAVRFTQGCIMRTWARGTDPRYGVDFEHELPRLIREMEPSFGN
ncbi:MAG TPA: pyridoxamine kinase [Clostridia bacterium]|nr:pyridoxamine kinase [Clostridia bacterium]